MPKSKKRRSGRQTGFVKPKYHDYIRSKAWAHTRKQKLRRAGFRCQSCGKGGYLEVHHLTYERLGREKLADLQVLCRECHERVHEVSAQAARHLRSISLE